MVQLSLNVLHVFLKQFHLEQAEAQNVNGRERSSCRLNYTMGGPHLLLDAYDAGILWGKQVEDCIEESQIQFQIHFLDQYLEVPEEKMTGLWNILRIDHSPDHPIGDLSNRVKEILPNGNK